MVAIRYTRSEDIANGAQELHFHSQIATSQNGRPPLALLIMHRFYDWISCAISNWDSTAQVWPTSIRLPSDFPPSAPSLLSKYHTMLLQPYSIMHMCNPCNEYLRLSLLLIETDTSARNSGLVPARYAQCSSAGLSCRLP